MRVSHFSRTRVLRLTRNKLLHVHNVQGHQSVQILKTLKVFITSPPRRKKYIEEREKQLAEDCLIFKFIENKLENFCLD